MTQCHHCQSRRISKGLAVEGSRARARAPVFKPDGQRTWSFSLFGGIYTNKEAYACLDCGFVASFTDPQKLETFIKRHCEPAIVSALFPEAE